MHTIVMYILYYLLFFSLSHLIPVAKQDQDILSSKNQMNFYEKPQNTMGETLATLKSVCILYWFTGDRFSNQNFQKGSSATKFLQNLLVSAEKWLKSNIYVIRTSDL